AIRQCSNTSSERIDARCDLARLLGQTTKLVAAGNQLRFVTRIPGDALGDALGSVSRKREQLTPGVRDALACDGTERAREGLLDEPRKRLRKFLQRTAQRGIALLVHVLIPLPRISEKRRNAERRYRQ